MRFAKMHGLGNDFVMVNGFQEQLPDDLNSLAVAVCDRHLGLGADGLIVLCPATRADAVARFLIYNDDGSQAESCGNGLRCAALFAKKEGITDQDTFTFELINGIAKPSVLDWQQGIVRVDMDEPRLAPAQIPALFIGKQVVSHPLPVGSQTYAVTLVSMGNPHCVIFVDNTAAFPVTEIGPLIETNPAFPEKTNVEFIKVLSSSCLEMRVWERGCGETLACGTGACAATVAAYLNGYADRSVEVMLKHGPLQIEWADNNHVYLTGPATLVAEGDYQL
ncbi:MAG: diaminopimelate epimerase [Firmicutes bacterium]|nr:diaminopimelate epimerase [Bacillota bacterium]